LKWAFADLVCSGNARIQGMTEDLKMTGDDYNVALFTFFVTYILFEVRSPIRVFKVFSVANIPVKDRSLLAPP
jgi:hypothetical protein